MEPTLICRLINVREHTRSSKNGLIYTVVAHLRNICRKINLWIDVNKYAIEKMHEVKPSPREDNPLTPESNWSAFKERVDGKYPWLPARYTPRFLWNHRRLWYWFGQGWWGGSTDPNIPGNFSPQNSVDAVAMRHDFGYQIAQELSAGNANLHRAIQSIADIIVIRDAWNLEEANFSANAAEATHIEEMRGFMIAVFVHKIENIDSPFTGFLEADEMSIMDAFRVDVPIERMNSITYITNDNDTIGDNGNQNVSLSIEHLDKLIDQKVFEWWKKHRETQLEEKTAKPLNGHNGKDG